MPARAKLSGMIRRANTDQRRHHALRTVRQVDRRGFQVLYPLRRAGSRRRPPSADARAPRNQLLSATGATPSPPPHRAPSQRRARRRRHSARPPAPPRHPRRGARNVDAAGIIARVKNILLTPRTEWPVISAEAKTSAEVWMGYVAPLVAISAIAGGLGMMLFGIHVPLLGTSASGRYRRSRTWSCNS